MNYLNINYLYVNVIGYYYINISNIQVLFNIISIIYWTKYMDYSFIYYLYYYLFYIVLRFGITQWIIITIWIVVTFYIYWYLLYI